MHTILYIGIACTLFFCILYVSDMRAQALARVGECVATTAKAQGYAGNPYSADAWHTFASNCKQ